MDQNNHEKSSYQRAYAAWFSRYEHERRRQKKRPGANLADFPAQPTSPHYIAEAVDRIGTHRVLNTLQIHRSTLARWLAGDSVIPRPAWLVLVMLAEGRLPGMSDDWRDFRFDGDRLTLIGTRYSWTPREIAGWPYQLALIDALQRQIAGLKKDNAHLLKTGNFEAANDPLMQVG